MYQVPVFPFIDIHSRFEYQHAKHIKAKSIKLNQGVPKCAQMMNVAPQKPLPVVEQQEGRPPNLCSLLPCVGSTWLTQACNGLRLFLSLTHNPASVG